LNCEISEPGGKLLKDGPGDAPRCSEKELNLVDPLFGRHDIGAAGIPLSSPIFATPFVPIRKQRVSILTTASAVLAAFDLDGHWNELVEIKLRFAILCNAETFVHKTA
jgi:hypothetical protein